MADNTREFDYDMTKSKVELCRASHEAMGEWLSGFPWNWYTTHTFAKADTTPRQADQRWQSWLNTLNLQCKVLDLPRPAYARVTEYQQRGTIHYHALIAGVEPVRRLLFKDLWEVHGFARVEAYDHERRATFYLGKYLTKTDGDIRLSWSLIKK